MGNIVKRFWQEESGMGTVEVVFIVAVLVGIALLFKGQITTFVKLALDKIFDPDKIDKAINIEK